MTADRFRQCLAALHWSQRGFADFMGIDDRSVRRWAVGQNPIPDALGQWLEGLARYIEEHPQPRP